MNPPVGESYVDECYGNQNFSTQRIHATTKDQCVCMCVCETLIKDLIPKWRLTPTLEVAPTMEGPPLIWQFFHSKSNFINRDK